MQKLLSRIRRLFAKRLPGLRSEVSGLLPLLNALESQIKDVMQRGNQACDRVAHSFSQMARWAREAVDYASDVGDNELETSVDQVREVVQSLVTQIQKTNDSVANTAQMISTIETNLGEIDACMSKIDDVAGRSRMVSLNGQIEAVKAGESGQGFSVVSAETGVLAQSISEISRTTRQVVDRLKKDLGAASKQTSEMVQADREATAACEQKVQDMLAGLAGYQQHLVNNLQLARQSGNQLATSISQSVQQLQFQDAASQRLDHIAQCLTEMQSTLQDHVSEPSYGVAQKRSEAWLMKYSAMFTMDEERQAIDLSPAEEPSESTASNVELF